MKNNPYIGFHVPLSLTLNIDGKDTNVDFEAEIEAMGNDGIGAYEYWGARYFDRGIDYVESFLVKIKSIDGNSPIQNKVKERVLTFLYEDPNTQEWITEQLAEKADLRY